MPTVSDAMKKLFFFWAALLSLLPAAKAQDVLLLQNADEITAQVLEIGETDIVYRVFGDNDGPVRRIGRDQVVRITYANGEKEMFTKPSGGYPYPTLRRTYSVGELFEEDGVRGIVIATDADGRHGLLMSLSGARLPYGAALTSAGNDALLCADADDGWNNHAALDRFLSASGLSIDNFPAFAWCKRLGPGWYLPAENELRLLAQCVLSKTEPETTAQQTKICRWINETSRLYGGEDSIDWFFDSLLLWSSTERPDGNAAVLVWSKCKHISLKPYSETLSYPARNGVPKQYVLNVRAFHKF